jgi:hypothetical protein
LRSALAEHCYYGCESTARMLLQHGACVNQRSSIAGATPLLEAVENAEVDCVALLLEAKADVSIPTHELLISPLDLMKPGEGRYCEQMGGKPLARLLDSYVPPEDHEVSPAAEFYHDYRRLPEQWRRAALCLLCCARRLQDGQLFAAFEHNVLPRWAEMERKAHNIELQRAAKEYFRQQQEAAWHRDI